MTYGDIAPDVLQTRFEEQVLNRFEKLDRTIQVEPAKRYHSPVRVQEGYATQEEETTDKTHIVVSWLLGESINLDDRLRSHLLSSVLLDNSASPLMRALEQSEIGNSPSPLCGLEDSNREMVFACGLEGSNPDQTLAVEKLVLDVLQSIARDGVPQEQVDAVLHQLELSQREIRGDGMPFGLQLVLGGLSSAMQRGDTLAAIDLDPALERLRLASKEPDFISNLVKELLLENPHRVTLTMAPDKEISDRRNAAEKERLSTMKDAMSDDDKKRTVDQAQALAERQVQEDDPEILPKVTLEDVPVEMHIPTSKSTRIKGAPATLYAQGTNGLIYQHVVVDLPQLEPDLQTVLPLYTNFSAELGSGGRDYLATQNEQAAVTGGIGTYIMQRGAVDDEQAVKGYMVVRGKALLRNTDALSGLMLDTLANVRFDETSRIRELVSQSRAGREQSITGSGHMLAMMAAASGMSPTIRLSHQLNGLAGIQAIKALDDSLDNPQALNELCEKMAAIHAIMREAPRQFMIVAEEENISTVLASMGSAFGASPVNNEFDTFSPAPVREQSKQLWTTSTEVSFSAKAFPTVPSAHKDSAALAVLGPFLRNGFLHRAIRETGGAYGGGASQDSDTASFRFYSYRDPRLAETLNDFDASIDWLQTNKHEERELEESILNVISGIDKPGSPAGEARSTFQAELFDRTADRRRLFRQRILEVTLEDLKRVGQTYLDPTKASTGVVTNEGASKTDEVVALKLDKRGDLVYENRVA